MTMDTISKCPPDLSGIVEILSAVRYLGRDPFLRSICERALGPVLSVRVHSPTEGVIGVRIDHFRHVEPKPAIALFPDAHAPPIKKHSHGSRLGGGDASETVHTLSTAGLTAEITSNPYTVTFKAAHRTLTFAGYKHQGVYEVPYKWTQNTAANTSCLATDSNSNPVAERTPDVVRYVHSELNLSPGELIYGLGEQFTAFVKNGAWRVILYGS
jgi:hypothetical protein